MNKRDKAKVARSYLHESTLHAQKAKNILQDIGDKKGAEKAEKAEKEAKDAEEHIVECLEERK